MNNLLLRPPTINCLYYTMYDSLYWNILVSDDDFDVFAVTRLVLEGQVLFSKTMRVFYASNEEETRKALSSKEEYCVLLLDVVMDSQRSGLKLTEFIRDIQKNKKLRIILRTGQPGSAPERDVITQYDINDYKEKTELTSTKLYTTVVSAIRAYRDISIIENGRRGLQQIIHATQNILEYSSLNELAGGILQQISLLIGYTPSSLIAHHQGGLIAHNGHTLDHFCITHATGIFEESIGKPISNVVKDNYINDIKSTIQSNNALFRDNVYLSTLKSGTDSQDIIFFKAEHSFSKLDQQVLDLFQSNFVLAYNNLQLHEDIRDIQYDIIYKLANTVESRSQQTGNHIRRISEHTFLLSSIIGLALETCKLYELASTMHDIGKIGISDSILLKPSKLTNEEFDTIKAHTTIGHHILKGTEKSIFKVAAVIALSHHEHWSGNGYPNGIAGESIPVEARIVAIVDVFDALSHNRCYKDAWSNDKVTQLFIDESGKQFDPVICRAFIEHIDEFFAINTHYDQRTNIL
jgi:response regulator RpfG family c-di-GMP phosphodiesterase